MKKNIELTQQQIDLLLECALTIQLFSDSSTELQETMLDKWSWYDSDTPFNVYVTQVLDSCVRKLTGKE